MGNKPPQGNVPTVPPNVSPQRTCGTPFSAKVHSWLGCGNQRLSIHTVPFQPLLPATLLCVVTCSTGHLTCLEVAGIKREREKWGGLCLPWELRLREFAGGENRTFHQFLLHLKHLQSVAYLTGSQKPSTPLWCARLPLLPSSRSPLYALGHFVSKIINDLKLKEK